MTSPTSNRRPRSLEVPGVTHGAAPIPMGARVGNMIFSSGIMGRNPVNNTLPADVASQARFVFENMRALLKAGEASLDDVVRLTAYVTSDAARAALNTEWLQCFPHPHDRPARHTVLKDLPDGMLLQIEIVAVAP